MRTLLCWLTAVCFSVGIVALPMMDRRNQTVTATRLIPPLNIERPPDLSYDVASSYVVVTIPEPTTTVPPRPAGKRSGRSRSSVPVMGGAGGGDCSGQRERIARHFRAEDVGRACRIMACESSGDPNAISPSGRHHGLMQIAGGTFDPEGNVAHAAQMAYTTPKGWTHWTCK